MGQQEIVGLNQGIVANQNNLRDIIDRYKKHRNKVNKSLRQIKRNLSSADVRLNNVDNRLNNVDSRLENIIELLGDQDSRSDTLREDLTIAQNQIRKLNIDLEKEHLNTLELIKVQNAKRRNSIRYLIGLIENDRARAVDEERRIEQRSIAEERRIEQRAISGLRAEIRRAEEKENQLDQRIEELRNKLERKIDDERARAVSEERRIEQRAVSGLRGLQRSTDRDTEETRQQIADESKRAQNTLELIKVQNAKRRNSIRYLIGLIENDRARAVDEERRIEQRSIAEERRIEQRAISG